MASSGIPERYKNMGFTHVGQKMKGDGKHKWKVLAKKGDQYKVVQGGWRGMDDFSQHHSEKRKERFWDRMGGKNSSKAKDPFSPLYWHKRLGTWEQGGEIDQYKEGGIYIQPNKRGTFKAQATRMGMGVQEAAAHILANKKKYSPAMVKKANFARNFAKEYGGIINNEDIVNEELMNYYNMNNYRKGGLTWSDNAWYDISGDSPQYMYGPGGPAPKNGEKPKPAGRDSYDLERKNQKAYFFQGFNPTQEYFANQMYNRYGKVVMTDKANNRTYYGTKKPNGEWDINEFEVLTGRQSDPSRQERNGYTVPELDKRPGDRVTPIGVYPLQYVKDIYGTPGYYLTGSSLKPNVFDAYHVTFEDQNDMTRKFLYNNKNAKDNYKSYGCINCEKPSLENLIKFVGTDNDDFSTIIDSRLTQEEIDEWMKKNTPKTAYVPRSEKYKIDLPGVGIVASDNTRVAQRPVLPIKQQPVLQQPPKSEPVAKQPVKSAPVVKAPIKTTPIQQAPVKASQPVAVRPTLNTGVSVVDYLVSTGKKYDKEYRASLAQELGIKDYDYSASKNLELLARLKERDKIAAEAATRSNVKYGGQPCYECGGMYAYGGNTLPYFQGDQYSSQYGPDDDISYIEEQEALKRAQQASKLRTFVNPDDDNFYGDEYKFPMLDEGEVYKLPPDNNGSFVGPPTLEDWYAQQQAQQQAQQAAIAQAQQKEEARKEEAAKEAKAAEPVVQPSAKSKPSYKIGSEKDPSIVNFLYSRNKAFDFDTRAQLAASKGITNYKGTAAQNTYLLAILRAEEAKTNPKNKANNTAANQGSTEDPQIQQAMDLYNQAASAQESGDPGSNYWLPNIPGWTTDAALGAAGLYGANKIFQRYGQMGPNAPWLRQMRDFEAAARPGWKPKMPDVKAAVAKVPNVLAGKLNYPIEQFHHVQINPEVAKSNARIIRAENKKAIAEHLKKEAEAAAKKSTGYWDDVLRFGQKVLTRLPRRRLEYGGYPYEMNNEGYLPHYQGAKGSSQVNNNVFDDVYNYLDNHNVLDHLWNVPMLWKNKKERAERMKEWGDKFPTNVIPYNNTETIANIGQYFIPYYGAGLLGTQVASALGARNLSDEDKAVEAVAAAIPYGIGKAGKGIVKRAAKLMGRKNGGPVVGEVMDVTPQQAEMLRQQGYTFENI